MPATLSRVAGVAFADTRALRARFDLPAELLTADRANAKLAKGAALGVHTERLAFSFKFPQDDYVAFRALADLTVDNLAYNGHTTGADTLWAGVPGEHCGPVMGSSQGEQKVHA